MAASLSGSDAMSPEYVNQVISALDVGDYARIVVTNNEGLIMYDTADGGVNVGCYALFSEITTALNGYDVFYCQFSEGAFMSRAAIPVVNRSGESITTTGAVYLYESDTQQAGLILATQSNLRNVSIIICVVSVLLAILFSNSLTHRIKALLQGIREVRDGDYNYKIIMKGKDELSQLAGEFNGLTERLKDTEEMRRRFVSDASHELKTPLASINLLSDSIVQNTEMSIDTVRDFVNDIGHEANRLTRTTEKLLSLTRIDSGAFNAVRQPVDVGHVAEGALHMLKPLADKNGVRIITDLEEGCHVLSTEDDFYQIIFNLAENGIKYNIYGGTLTVSLHCKDGELRLVFEDTGIGVPEEDVPHLFERFYRVDKARSRELGGSGLGLAIVKDTVLDYGGRVEVATRASGKGTRFTVVFPEYKAGDGAEIIESVENDTASPDLGGPGDLSVGLGMREADTQHKGGDYGD